MNSHPLISSVLHTTKHTRAHAHTTQELTSLGFKRSYLAVFPPAPLSCASVRLPEAAPNIITAATSSFAYNSIARRFTKFPKRCHVCYYVYVFVRQYDIHMLTHTYPHMYMFSSFCLISEISFYCIFHFNVQAQLRDCQTGRQTLQGFTETFSAHKA